MTEQAGPKDLVDYAVRAEQVGFDFEVCSDHFTPWLTSQGHAPNAWAVLGAVAHATDRVGLYSFVTCPTMRYHPAVVAQQAATVQIMADGRFVLGLGSGENLNEHVIGAGWPAAPRRLDMLAEAIKVIRELLGGELVDHRGEFFAVESARIWDVPDDPVGIAVSITGVAGPGASGPKPEGMVCFGLARRGAVPVTETVQFGALGRAEVRAASRDHALGMVLAAVGPQGHAPSRG